MKPKAYIVVFDDEQGLTVPYGWDERCDGAICCASGDPVALFETRKAAKKAIEISRRYAELVKAQGGPVNSDFLLPAIKFVNIVPCVE